MATLTYNNQNIALLLVENGWASVIRHRRDDADRSPIYDELLIAEQEAQKEQKGIWSPKPPSTKPYVDASESVQKAKIQLSVLQRQKRVPAIVDFVKSGSRFTVLIPRENAKMTLVLSGIRAPKSARGPDDEGEPFGQEAHDFANRRCNQRDVELDIENIDRNGGFIGTLYINRESLAKLLVEEGLATVHGYSAEQSGNSRELYAAEQRAKDARKNLWKDWDPSHDDAGADETADQLASTDLNGDAGAARKKDYRDVLITSIDPNCHLRVQQLGAGTTALSELMRQFAAFHASNANSTGLPGSPKTGEYVAARFTEDNQWYRAKILHNDHSAKKAEVLYIDYGNSETLPWTALRPLTQPQFNVQKLRPQAVEAALSFLQFPTQPDYLEDAKEWLTSRTGGRQLVANVDAQAAEKEGGMLYVTLFDPERSESGKESVNADVVGEGWAMVARKLRPWERADKEGLTTLKEKETIAREGRKGVWEYGDLTED
jgi:staphylococcal nuclease domain-containing protein 1